MFKYYDIDEIYVKFVRVENSKNMVSFITKIHHGPWRGCRMEDECDKIVVVPAKAIVASLKENKLYKCKLVPMIHKHGYVAVEAELVKHKAAIETLPMDNNHYQIIIKWGNRKLVYDPFSRNPQIKSADNIIRQLLEKDDILNVQDLICDFENTIDLTLEYYASK